MPGGGGNGLIPAGRLATALYVAFIGVPLAALFFRALQGPFFQSLTGNVALQALRLSLMTSTMSLVIILLAGTPFAYLLARRRSRWLGLIDSLVELPIVLPPVVAGVAMLMAFGRRGILGAPLEAVGITLPFTTAAVVLAQVFIAAPFYVRSARIGFEGVGTGLEEVAQTLGLSPWRCFLRLTLPLAKPGIIGGAALAWARAMSEFGATIMFAGNFVGTTQTMPLAILSAMESDIPAALSLAVLLTVISAGLLVILGLTARRSEVRP